MYQGCCTTYRSLDGGCRDFEAEISSKSSFILMNTLVLLLRERKLELCTFFCRAGRLFHHNTSCMPA